jgi:hypothetical protein
MFEMLGAVMGVQMAVEQLRKEQASVEAAKASMTPEQFNAWFSAWLAFKEKQQAAATEERRHRELCEAIRSTSFWRLGA